MCVPLPSGVGAGANPLDRMQQVWNKLLHVVGWLTARLVAATEEGGRRLLAIRRPPRLHPGSPRVHVSRAIAAAEGSSRAGSVSGSLPINTKPLVPSTSSQMADYIGLYITQLPRARDISSMLPLPPPPKLDASTAHQPQPQQRGSDPSLQRETERAPPQAQAAAAAAAPKCS